jgi:DNA-binding NarL/FixJ family response regulator
MFNTVIIDDDLLTQEALKDLLEHEFKEFRVVGIFSSVKESLAEIPDLNPDLVLLDIIRIEYSNL